MRRILSAAALAAVLGASAIASDKGSTPPDSAAAVPAGEYTLDKAHASLIFKVSHIGFSNYTARFKRFDAKLQFDPAKLTASKLIATVDVKSLETDYPDPLKLDFNAQLLGQELTLTGTRTDFRSNDEKIEVHDFGGSHIYVAPPAEHRRCRRDLRPQDASLAERDAVLPCRCTLRSPRVVVGL